MEENYEKINSVLHKLLYISSIVADKDIKNYLHEVRVDLLSDVDKTKEKKWFKSKTILSNIFSFVVAILFLIDAHFGTKLMDTNLMCFLISLASVTGIYGRITANRKIDNGQLV